MKKKKLTSVFIFLLLAVPCQARIIFVDANTPDNNDGSSWPKAYKYLQDALADANSTGDVDEIRVAQGIYTPDSNSADPNGSGNRRAAFQLINGVTIKGGYAGFGQPDPNARDIEIYGTILSGDLLDNDDPCIPVEDMLDDPCRADNCYHLFYHPNGTDLNTTAILDGFTITAGNADGSAPHYKGGGMYNGESSPTVANCTFSGNSARCGGGMSNIGGSSPTITNCAFSGNSAILGGGMRNSIDSNPTLTNCTFSNNSAEVGGGMENYQGSNSTLTNCTFFGNSAGRYGGGMYNQESSPTLTNCTFSGNSAGDLGGGMGNFFYSIPTVTNCTFSGNSASSGGGMYNHTGFGLPIRPVVTNCILWGNTAPEGSQIYNDGTGSAIVTYSDVQGGYSGTGNINADPCFIEPGYWADVNDLNIVVEPNDPNAIWVEGDYHLLPISPCIDAGDLNYVPEPNETDLDGNPRVNSGRIDMGTYESIMHEARLWLWPRVIKRKSRRPKIMAWVHLPQGITKDQVDKDVPLILYPGGRKAVRQFVIQNRRRCTRRTSVFAFFNKAELMDAIDTNGPVQLMVLGHLLEPGQYFYGSDTIRIIAPRPLRRPPHRPSHHRH